jgi:hypothetical protein
LQPVGSLLEPALWGWLVIANCRPPLRGVVFDLPSGSAEASRKLADAQVDDRCEVVSGDFFRPARASDPLKSQARREVGEGRAGPTGGSAWNPPLCLPLRLPAPTRPADQWGPAGNRSPHPAEPTHERPLRLVRSARRWTTGGWALAVGNSDVCVSPEGDRIADALAS